MVPVHSSYNNKHYNNRKNNKKTTERWQKTDHLQECTTEIISKFGTKSPIHLFYTRNHSWLSVKCKNAGHLHYFKRQSDRSLKGTPSKDASRLENRKFETISICKLCTVDQPLSNASTLLFCTWTPHVCSSPVISRKMVGSWHLCHLCQACPFCW